MTSDKWRFGRSLADMPSSPQQQLLPAFPRVRRSAKIKSQGKTMSVTSIAIHGAAGRMGQRLIALAAADPQLKLVAAIEHIGHPQLGRDVGLIAGGGETGVHLSEKLTAPVDVVIDFSIPAAALGMVRTCVA